MPFVFAFWLIEDRLDWTVVELNDLSCTFYFRVHRLPTCLHSSEGYCHPRVMTFMIDAGVDTMFADDIVSVRPENWSLNTV